MGKHMIKCLSPGYLSIDFERMENTFLKFHEQSNDMLIDFLPPEIIKVLSKFKAFADLGLAES